ncbi:MAG: SDR family NAD(P)-dependent oxidoreductase [Gemmatimonadales bacterium]|jgi:serine 3-dehydrogenase|nr:SDR family NAD(P)-dependent oxidoreductase [Gemmatimonadales bacterium]MBT4188169.1 SDR family NAD(P)-dependent oxidoreductase [Gemmatimonadales bacterium]MBT4437008.1 SDR family NAD(P)-dependent oxidoreductase [Gemmatimonadales bacterium]MBT6889039.1 SDR family NAD(P)-dependent oxidoreductase [Gemmatimonadales bacterium]
MNRLAGKRVLITGASAGIGEACARSLASHGAHLLLSARRLEKVEALANALREEYGVEAHAAAVDVADKQVVTDYVANLVSEGLVPDVLINNAGKARGFDKLHEGSLDDWDDMIDTNVKGLLYMSRAIIPLMVERDSGHIINIGSIAGRWVYPKGAVYNATKFAVWALNEGMNIDLAGTALRVSSVDPGLTETEFSEVRFDGDTARASSVYSDTKPLAAEDIADAVYYVANTPAHVDVINLVIMPTVQRHAMILQRDG